MEQQTNEHIEHLLNLGTIAPELGSDVRQFLELCDQLIDMTRIENDLLFADDSAINPERTNKRAELLEHFENNIPRISQRLNSTTPDDIALSMVVVQRVSTLQELLRLNTELHFHIMKSASAALNNGDMQRETRTCH